MLPRLQKQFFLNGLKNFNPFPSECLLSLIGRVLQDLPKKDVVKFRRKILDLKRKSSFYTKAESFSNKTKGYNWY